MKKFVAFAVAVAAVPALVGPSFAQTEKKPTTGGPRPKEAGHVGSGQDGPRPAGGGDEEPGR